MADIKYNTMRFLTDTFNPYIKQALLISQTPVDLTAFNRLDKITVQGSEPDGSKRRFMFQMDGKTYKFSGQDLVEYTGTVNIDNVLASGNTAAQLAAVQYNTALVGKKIYPVIALYAESQDLPTAKLVFSATDANEVLDYTFEPNQMSCHGMLLGFGWDTEVHGAASAGFKVKIKNEANGEWSDYMTLTEAKRQHAWKIQPKWYFHVDAVAPENYVTINSFSVYYSPDENFRVYGDTAYLTSVVKNFGVNLTGCVLVVRHEPLDGGSLAAHVCFQKKRKSVSDEVLGYKSSGVYKTANKFLPSTLKVYVNGNVAESFIIKPDCQSFEVYESQWATAPYSVSCDYSYGADDEEWLEMTADTPEPTDNGLYASRFYLANAAANKPLGAIRITVNRARSTNSTTRVATGEEQRVQFSRDPDEVYCDAEEWIHDGENNEIIFTSPEGQTVNISYDWHGETPVIRGWTAAFSA